MYSEPTISPNFVVRQKRKLSRHPLILGGIACIVIFTIVGLMSLFANPATEDPDPQITFESRITFQTTPTAEVTPEPEVAIQAPVIVVSEPVVNEDNTASSQTVTTEARCSISTTGDTNVNIRSGPDVSFSLISSLINRDRVDAIAMSDNLWFQILNTDGTIGWVGGSVVDESGDCENLPRIQTPVCSLKNTTGNRVNIRDRATTESNIIRVLSTTDLLMADGRTETGWYRILISEELGWIYRDVVALSDSCANVPIISTDEPPPQPVVGQANLTFSEEACVIESFTGVAIDLHEGPGMEFGVVAKLNKAMVASRISSNGWYEIDGFGWAFAGDLVYQGLCKLLPTVTPEDVRGSLVIMSSG